MKRYDIDAVKENCVIHNKNNHENEELITEAKAKKYLRYVEYEKLKNSGISGIPVADYNDKKGNRVMLLAENAHTFIVGSTGTGKTQCHILPMIEKIAEDGCGSSFIAVDVKGELNQKSVLRLKENGYEVHVFNFNEPLRSAYYNPLAVIYEKFMEARNLEKEIDDSLAECIDDRKKKSDLLIRKSQVNLLDDFVMTEINKISESLVPLEGYKDLSWDYGSREIAKGIIYGMLEVAKREPFKMPLSKFTLANIYNILAGRGDDCDDMKAWYNSMPVDCNARLLLSQYFEINAKQTRDSYVVNAASKLQRYYGMAFQILTSGNDIDIIDLVNRLDNEKHAIFLVIDDSKSETYNLCHIFLNQLLKNLRDKAKLSPNKKLQRPFYFLMDEFCNMPPFADIEKWITSLRGFNIWLTMVVQSYEQMSERYSEGKANIVKGNCDIRIFLGSRNVATLETVSKEAGRTCEAMVGENISNNGEVSIHVSSAEVPLLKVSTLMRLKVGESVLFYMGRVFSLPNTPFYKRHDGEKEYVTTDQPLNRYYDRTKYFFSIASDRKRKNFSDFF